eukprot:scaffold57294_cov32-Tisochrysis_lutea.AAC.3
MNGVWAWLQEGVPIMPRMRRTLQKVFLSVALALVVSLVYHSYPAIALLASLAACHHSPPLARPRLSLLARCHLIRRRPRPRPPSSADGLEPVSVFEVVPTPAPTAGLAALVPSSLPLDPMGRSQIIVTGMCTC